MDISVIIPAYNEEENVVPLARRLSEVLRRIVRNYEIIFIDDASNDKTFEIIASHRAKDNHIKVIKFRSNFGQTAAMMAGFKHSKGKIVITMDADLQNSPEDIPGLLNKMREGYDVVNGWRHSRNDPFLTKRIPSFFSNMLARKLLGVKIHDVGCTLRAYRRAAIADLAMYGEMHRFIPAIIAAKGFKIGEIKVRHYKRASGKTKYGITRLPRGFLDLAYVAFWSSYSTKPLHFFGLLGLLQYVLGGLIFIEQLVKAYILHQLTVGPLFIVSVLLAITGTQFIIFGFLGEILIRAYYSNVEDSSYSIEKILD